MRCRQCKSESCRSFTSEIAIHFPGLEGLRKPIVLLFPQLLVCLDCGFTEFTVPKEEVSGLIGSKTLDGASVFDGNEFAAGE